MGTVVENELEAAGEIGIVGWGDTSADDVAD